MPEFSPAVIDHFTHPRHSRPIPYPHGEGWIRRSENRFMRIQIIVEEDHLTVLSFGTYGCAPAIACGSYVCEWAFGKTRQATSTLTVEAVLDALGGLPAHRRDCAEMAVEALQLAVSNSIEPKGEPRHDEA